MSSVNYTLDTIHFAQGAPSPLCGTLSVGKKKKKKKIERKEQGTEGMLCFPLLVCMPL